MTPEEPYEELGPLHGVQCFGTLLKKYKKKNRPAKWTKRYISFCRPLRGDNGCKRKDNHSPDLMDVLANITIFRFFILKECFLIYYSTGFKKTFEKTKRIDLHPKVVVSLFRNSFRESFHSLGVQLSVVGMWARSIVS